jgi:ribonuclease J
MNISQSGKLRLIPLGGLGEFGLHSMLLEWGDDALLIDTGAAFPSAELSGINKVVPDYRYLASRRGPLHGIFLTHGHEDHIGALSFALAAASAPVYGTRLTLAFARRSLDEHGRADDADLRELEAGTPVECGPFRIHPIPVAHSVLDSMALAIETPAGTVLATGDFKMSAERDSERTDAEALAEWGRRGVLVMLSGSTNVERSGRTGAEDDVVPAFEEIFARTRGKVLVSCLSSSIARMQRVAEVAERAGRRLGFVGRRVSDNARIARELDLLRFPESLVLARTDIDKAPRDKTALMVSGSQGESKAALCAIGAGTHPFVTVGPGDTVVLSARVIPGNERPVSALISQLYRRGCTVAHPGNAKVHVSGHGSHDDLLQMMDLVRPRYLVPIHGEYRMLAQHAELGREAGLRAEQLLVTESGEVLEFENGTAHRAGSVPVGRVMLDDTGEVVEAEVVRERRHLAAEGVVVPVVLLGKATGRLEGIPTVVTRGVLDLRQQADLLQDAARFVAEAVDTRSPAERSDPSLLRERLRLELRRFFRRRAQRRPMVIPVVMEV